MPTADLVCVLKAQQYVGASTGRGISRIRRASTCGKKWREAL